MQAILRHLPRGNFRVGPRLGKSSTIRLAKIEKWKRKIDKRMPILVLAIDEKAIANKMLFIRKASRVSEWAVSAPECEIRDIFFIEKENISTNSRFFFDRKGS